MLPHILNKRLDKTLNLIRDVVKVVPVAFHPLSRIRTTTNVEKNQLT
jgi:hypothetical protein